MNQSTSRNVRKSQTLAYAGLQVLATLVATNLVIGAGVYYGATTAVSLLTAGCVAVGIFALGDYLEPRILPKNDG